MIGTTFHVRPGIGFWPVFLFAIGIALVGMSMATVSPHWAIGAVWPVLLAAALIVEREGECRISFSEDALTLESQGKSVPYSEIEALSYRGSVRSPGHPLKIITDRGCLRIPASSDDSNWRIFEFLASRLDSSGSRGLPVILWDHMSQQIATFGETKVFTFISRQFFQPPGVRRKTLAIGAASFFTGCLWIAAAAVMGLQTIAAGWMVAGFSLAIFGPILLAAAFVSNRPQSSSPYWYFLFGPLGIFFYYVSTGTGKKLKNSGIIVSPRGIALLQGDLQGEVRWKELSDVRLKKKSETSAERYSCAQLRWLELNLGGTVIRIEDIYDRPLALIHDRIMAYWQ